jgi:hypothetical protein
VITVELIVFVTTAGGIQVTQYYETPVSVAARCVGVKSIHNHTTGLKTNKHFLQQHSQLWREFSVTAAPASRPRKVQSRDRAFDDEILHTVP